jgi:MFS-type transporter involved in bile tolerance (Atg22 family)
MNMTGTTYVAGVCNIGDEEIARRRNFGFVMLAVAIVLLAVLVWAALNPWWRLFVFFPAMMSASGFLQAYFGFCSGFARKGIFNFDAIGQTSQVTDETARASDKRKGNSITLYAMLIGALSPS